jgi:hypothetical protein
MRRHATVAALAAICFWGMGAMTGAHAKCPIPHIMANGQMPDATQMMANFNALVTCLSTGGATNSIQYNAGAGSLAGLGPLTDGQLAIGSTGSAPQAQALSAGTGIAITNAAGSVTIARTAATAGTGLYQQIMSATPTSASTGLTTWLNQGSAVVSNSAVGLAIDAPPSGTTNLSGRYAAAPSTPYTITALLGATRNSVRFCPMRPVVEARAARLFESDSSPIPPRHPPSTSRVQTTSFPSPFGFRYKTMARTCPLASARTASIS